MLTRHIKLHCRQQILAMICTGKKIALDNWKKYRKKTCRNYFRFCEFFSWVLPSFLLWGSKASSTQSWMFSIFFLGKLTTFILYSKDVTEVPVFQNPHLLQDTKLFWVNHWPWLWHRAGLSWELCLQKNPDSTWQKWKVKCLLQPSKEESLETKKYLGTSVLTQFCPKSCAGWGVNPCTVTACGPTDWKQQQKENDLGFLVGKLNTSQQHARTAKNANSILGCTRWSIARDAAPFLLSTAKVCWSAGVQFWALR